MSKAKELVAKTTVKTVVKYVLTILLTVTACFGVKEILNAEDRFDELLKKHDNIVRVSEARRDSIQGINQAVAALEEQITEKNSDIAVLNTYGHRLAGTVTELTTELAVAIADSNFTDQERLDIAIVTIATQDSSIKVCEEKFNACQQKSVMFESIVDSLQRSNSIITRDRDEFEFIAEELRKSKECKLPLGIKCPSRGIMLVFGGIGGFIAGYMVNDNSTEVIIVDQ